VLFAVTSGSALLGISMHLYPGGTALHARARGHSFWLNFLCDLTEPAARNGAPNPVGSWIARAAMLDLSLALGVTWLVVPALVGEQRASARAIRLAGGLSVAALIAVPLAEGTAHIIAIYAAAAAALSAGIVTLVRGGGPPHRWILLAAVLACTVADSVFYAQSVATHSRVVLPPLPIFQRVAVLLALAWMVAVALELLGTRRRARGPRAAARARS
jgi:hypothetical protein